jgi:hypothetical protein
MKLMGSVASTDPRTEAISVEEAQGLGVPRAPSRENAIECPAVSVPRTGNRELAVFPLLFSRQMSKEVTRERRQLFLATDTDREPPRRPIVLKWKDANLG